MSAGGDVKLPRALLWIGVPVAGVLLTAFFFVLGFPFDLVRDTLATRISEATGAQVEIAGLGPSITPLGPQLVADRVQVTLADGTRIGLDEARLRPAWSPSWLRGNPALALDLRAPEGRLVGTAWVGGAPGFDGALREVSLEKLPLDRFVPDLVLAGVADLEVDVRSGDAGPSGRLELAAHDGRIGVPGMPVDLPYATLEGRAELGGETRVRLERLHMDGPMLSFDADGTLGQGPSLESSPLDATVRVEVREPSVRPMVRNLGVRLDRDGRAEVRLAGTPARPVVR